jgi:hypothetical protein
MKHIILPLHVGSIKNIPSHIVHINFENIYRGILKSLK